MLGFSTTLINLTEGNKKNLFNFPRLKTHQSLTILFLPKLTGTSTSTSMSQPPSRHPRTHPSSKLLLCTEVMITRRGWQWLGVMGSHSKGCQCALRSPEPTGHPKCYLHAITLCWRSDHREANKSQIHSQGNSSFLWQDRYKEKQTHTSNTFLLT